MSDYYNEFKEAISERVEANDMTYENSFAYYGYLCGLLEFGHIETEEFDNLSDMLPQIKGKTIDISFSGLGTDD